MLRKLHLLHIMNNTTKSLAKTKKDRVIYIRVPNEAYKQLAIEAKQDDRAIGFIARKYLLNGLTTKA